MNGGSLTTVNLSSFLAMSYRRTETVLSRLADKRTRILKSARSLVAEGGWQCAHIATVAQNAGLATGTVYRYFPSKAQLYAEVLSQVSSRERDVVAAIADGDGEPDAKFAGAVRTFASRALRARRLAYALIAEPCDPEIDKARLYWRAELSREFVRLIENGQREGVFRICDAVIAGACVLGALMEALVGPLAPEAPGDSDAAQKLIDEIANSCLAFVAVSRQQARTSLRSSK
jgi:AcrR family transcriptional regulator